MHYTRVHLRLRLRETILSTYTRKFSEISFIATHRLQHATVLCGPGPAPKGSSIGLGPNPLRSLSNFLFIQPFCLPFHTSSQGSFGRHIYGAVIWAMFGSAKVMIVSNTSQTVHFHRNVCLSSFLLRGLLCLFCLWSSTHYHVP